MRNSTVQLRISALYLPLALLVAIVAGATILPGRVQAQQAAPAANSAAQTPAPPAQPKAAESKSEDSGEAQTNAFRLEGPLVKAAAKGLNLSPETTARIFEIFNFSVIFLGIGIPLARFMPKLLRKRRDKLSYDIEAARKVTEDAKKRLSAIEAKLAGFDEEIAGIRAMVEDESRQDEARIKSAIEEESARIVASAGSEIDASAAQARRELRSFAADLAVEQAAKQLVLTPEIDQALINEFLTDAGFKPTNKPANSDSGGKSANPVGLIAANLVVEQASKPLALAPETELALPIDAELKAAKDAGPKPSTPGSFINFYLSGEEK